MARTITIEALDGSDLVALAQCMALDATAFPHPSVPFVTGGAPRVWIARGEHGVVGFVATMRRANVLEIVGLAVDPGHRRSGVGRTLLRTAIAMAIEDGRFVGVTLHVSTANEGAIALYEGEGFVAARRLRRFYNPARFPDGGDAYAMILRADLSRRPFGLSAALRADLSARRPRP